MNTMYKRIVWGGKESYSFENVQLDITAARVEIKEQQKKRGIPLFFYLYSMFSRQRSFYAALKHDNGGVYDDQAYCKCR